MNIRNALVSAIAVAAILRAQTIERPVRSVTDPGVITTRQTISPAGLPAIFQGKVWGVTFGKSPDELWVLTSSRLYHMDWRNNNVLANIEHNGLPGLQGVSFQGRPYITAVQRGKKAALFSVVDSSLQIVGGELGSVNAGGAAFGGAVAVAPLTSANKAAVVDLATGSVRGYAATGIAPFAAVVNRAGTVAYVSNWGGRVAVAGDKTARTGLDPKADPVVVDAKGIAASGTVTRIDLTTLQATHSIETGLHPNGLAWHEQSNRLYAANNNSDSITVIDTAKMSVVDTIRIQPFAQRAPGLAPTAVAVSADGNRLYAACGGINAVSVFDTSAGNKLLGMIPTGWYPNTLSLSPDGKFLAIGSLLGAGSGWRDEPNKRYVHANRGSVNVVEIPDDAQLARHSLAVSENNRLPMAGTTVASLPRATQPKSVPGRPGDASLIDHVVYIVKENRTYDQLFGDLSKGNGEPSFVMFGEDVAPNQRKLAQEFVLLDNFFASGGNSADGHQWLTQANEVAYTMWPGYQGRSYPFDGSDPIGIAQGGTIWDAALKHGKSVRVFGEYAGRMPEPQSRRIIHLQRWKDGADFSREFNVTAPIEHMNAFLARNYPTYTNSVPDVVRAQIFTKELAQWERDSKMPNLTLIQLPSDHTFGTTPGVSTPKAMVADNDLAVGQIVEALSHSKFWPKMAIFIVEDDAQNGVDHVDGHRTVALAISPYIRRGHVDSTFYSNQSMLKTIELMLGLAPLSLFDLIANDMRASFTDQPTLAPYKHAVPKQDLFELNPPARALTGSAKEAALASSRMRWDVPDAAPTDKLNRILWHSVKGWANAYPPVKQAVFAPFSLDVEDSDRSPR